MRTRGFGSSWRSAQQGFTFSWRSAQQGFTFSWRSAQQGFTSSWRSAQQGFTSSWRSAQQGFTLVEMLIALAIFGMITAAGVALLSLTVRTQESSERLLDSLGVLRRTGALLGADLGQAAPRVHRDRDGRPLPAFTGNDGGEAVLLGLVRRGWEDESAFRSSLQRVEYRLREGRLERWRYDAVDGEGRATAMTLLDNVRRIRLRYRDREGLWRERWDPTDPARLPTAVEMVSDSAGQSEVRMLFLVGSGR